MVMADRHAARFVAVVVGVVVAMTINPAASLSG